jgi:hypothetical protein
MKKLTKTHLLGIIKKQVEKLKAEREMETESVSTRMENTKNTMKQLTHGIKSQMKPQS